MKIAIIGSNSFIANSIAKHPGAIDIRGWSRKTTPIYNFPEFGISNMDISSFDDFDLVIYCAGGGIQPNHKDSDELIEALNFHEPIKLIERLIGESSFSGQLITFGSYFEIGHSTLQKAYTESQLISSNNQLPNTYCRSKKKLSSYIANEQTNKFKHLHLILTNVYGVGENEDRLLPYLARSFNKGNEVSLTSGEQIRQFTHVEDVVKFILDSRTRKLEGIYNFTNPSTMSVMEVVKQFASLVSFPVGKLNFSVTKKNDTGMPFLALDTGKIMQTHPDFEFKPIIKGLVEYI